MGKDRAFARLKDLELGKALGEIGDRLKNASVDLEPVEVPKLVEDYLAGKFVEDEEPPERTIEPVHE